MTKHVWGVKFASWVAIRVFEVVERMMSLYVARKEAKRVKEGVGRLRDDDELVDNFSR